MNILVMEASTTSAKAMIYNGVPEKVFVHQVRYEKCINNVKTQDIEGIYKTVLKCCKELIQKTKINDIDVIACSSVWQSYLLLDRDRNPIGDVKTWADSEAAVVIGNYKNNENIRSTFYQKTGCNIHSKYPCWKWFYDKQKKDINDLQVNISSVPEYLFEKLTTEAAVSKSVASGTGFFNVHTLQWDEDILDFMNVSQSQLSELKEYDYLGKLCKEAANELGTKQGIPVIIPGADGSLNQIGEGGLDGRIMTMSIGTSSAIRLSNNAPILPREPATWCYYIGDGARIVGATIAAGGNCIDWFINHLALGKLSFDDFEQNLCNVDIENAPTFLPFLDGEHSPGWEDTRLGNFANLTSHHNIYDIYYAVIEGIAFNLYHCFTFLIDLLESPEEIRLSGGIVNSCFWPQLVADIFNIPIIISKQQHASMKGALAIAQKVTGQINDIRAFKSIKGKSIKPVINSKKNSSNRFNKYMDCYQRMSSILR